MNRKWLLGEREYCGREWGLPVVVTKLAVGVLNRVDANHVPDSSVMHRVPAVMSSIVHVIVPDPLFTTS
jgi:hypothetical protein